MTIKNLLICLLMFSTFLFSCNKHEVNPPDPTDTEPESSLYQILDINSTLQDSCNVHYRVAAAITATFSQTSLLWTTDPSFRQYDSLILDKGSKRDLDSSLTFAQLKGPATYYFKLKIKGKHFDYESDEKTFSVKPLSFKLAKNSFKKGDTTFITYVDYNRCLAEDTGVQLYLNHSIPLKTAGFYCMGLYAYVPDSLSVGKYALTVRVHNITQDADSISILNGYWDLISPPDIPDGYYNGMKNGYGNYSVCGDMDKKAYLIGGLLWLPVNDIWDMEINTDYYYQRPYFIWEFDVATRKWSKRTMPDPKYFDYQTAQYYNNAIYVLSGWEATETNGYVDYVNSPLRLDLNTMAWSKMSPAPYTGASEQTSVSHDNLFYIGFGVQQIGDWDIHAFNQFWRYDPKTDHWLRLADLPETLDMNTSKHMTMVALGDNIYLYQADGYALRALWRYNIADNSWASVTLPPNEYLPFGEKYSVAAMGNQLLFFTAQQRMFGGQGNYILTNIACLAFDPLTGKYGQFSGPPLSDIMKVIGIKGDLVYLQSDQRGYNDGMYNYTYEFHYQQVQ